MPPVIDSSNIYSEAASHNLDPDLRRLPPRVYVPIESEGLVTVIDPLTFRVIGKFLTGRDPQHVVPSWDKKVLWVVNDRGNSVTPIDPVTGKPGKNIFVEDPYNMYFLPNGKLAIVVSEARRRLDFRDPGTMALKFSILTGCRGVNHLDYSADGLYFLASCEFSGQLLKVDTRTSRQVGSLELGPRSMPQDVRLSDDGRVFYVADMTADGVHLVDGETMKVVGFIPTGRGAHGLIVSRDGKRLYVSNRGWSTPAAGARGPGSVTVIDFSKRKAVAEWRVPGGGSPDMGNVSVDGSQLWVTGRYDSEVYCFETRRGRLMARIPTGALPHGLCYWPLPGRYSLGHTGNMR